VIAGSAVAVALAAGCIAGAGEDAAGTGAAAVQATAPPSARAAAGIATALAPAPLTPAELALQLQALLGQHSMLAADMMRGRLRNDPDLAQAADAALGKNTEAMGNLVGSAFGSQAEQAFTPLWSGHVTALFNYSRGVAERNEGVTAQAMVSISRFENQLADFFAAASQGRLSKAAAVSAVTAHVSHLLEQCDAYAAEEYARSDAAYRRGYAHSFELGRALASTLLPPADAKVLATPAWRLRSALNKLLGEHVQLVVAAMRAGATDAPDFGAAAAAVNGNTTDLAGAIGVLFGRKAATSFQQLWADHIDLLVAYAAAIAKGDGAARTRIGTGLRAFETTLAGFLHGATSDKVSAAALAKALQSHDTMLRQQTDAFVAKEYTAAHDAAYATYQEMYALSDRLAQAFGQAVAKRLPVGPADTGRGGMAAVVGGR